MIERVNTADIRRDLSELLGRVGETNQKVIICRYGKPIGALVSMPDFWRIWDDEDEERSGPINPESGRRQGSLIRADDPYGSAPDRWAKLYAKNRAAKLEARRQERYEARKAAAERAAAEGIGQRRGMWRWMMGLMGG